MYRGVEQIFEGLPQRRYEAGSRIFHNGDPVQRLHLVESGRVDLVRQSKSGALIILQRATNGQVLAEASVYSKAYHCDAFAVSESIVRVTSLSEFHRRLEEDPKLSRVWASYLAQAVQSSRLRAEIRALRTVAERLEAWIGADRPMPDKGEWQDLANELGVSREALYRELAKRRGY